MNQTHVKIYVRHQSGRQCVIFLTLVQ